MGGSRSKENHSLLLIGCEIDWGENKPPRLKTLYLKTGRPDFLPLVMLKALLLQS